ncbi:MFS transporter [Desulfitobacterium hafniense]|uniref:Major facilitator superfamily (MFS) profile domain-containing protein n=1 Tax=Desulfitobacterium hafniense (strain Y51) TaxID=138119 RepID=Q24N35_DESHY|nr:MFS transporter [Desulfitobacterium hafniense]BAE86557.1 hypothetical protein DSY4768 [Desulfitobacterium hafniense Y51]
MDKTYTSEFEKQTVSKVSRRLLPLLVACMFIAFLDRINIGFASLQMNSALGLSSAAYGFGAGLFFIGYFFFEVPSNMILEKIGARIWITRIMITWGFIAIGFAFVQGEKSFYIMRFLLGAAEAGFFPGVIFYLTKWFRAKERAAATAIFISGSYVAGIIGAPLSGGIMTYMNGLQGLDGWQWLFIVEGIPAVILAFIIWFYLPEKPQNAKWLEPEEREWVVDVISKEEAALTEKEHKSLLSALASPRTLMLSLVYVCYVGGNIGLQLWMPQIIQKVAGAATSTMNITLLTTLPYIAIIIAMIFWARHSDKTRERRWHVSVASLVAAVGLVISASASSLTISMLGLIITGLGMGGAQPTFWASVTQILDPKEAAVAIAVVNSVGNLGGFFGPNLMGVASTITGQYNAGIYIFASCFVLLLIFMQVLYKTNQKRFIDTMS